MLAVAPKETTTAAMNVASLDYVHPFPHDTNIAFASAGQRLFGLYNYWNAINYFNPQQTFIETILGQRAYRIYSTFYQCK